MRSSQEEQLMRDPLKVASNVAGLLMENDRVRVLSGSLKPGDKAAMHSHPDHVLYVTKGGKVRMTFPSGSADERELEVGKAIFVGAESHEFTNVGDTVVEFVVIELK
ncbi:MAG: cupin domain-containing protein [Methanomassiliicoccus sp.]|nr:cupin domain-containing protein [Methanomassiliicoccus sp.]